MAIDIILCVLCAVLAVVVVFVSNPMVSAFSLLSMFVVMGGIFFQLGTTFLSAVQVLVYAGAIAILFIFVLMLLNLDEVKKYPHKSTVGPIIGIVSALIILGIFAIIITNNFDYLSKDVLVKTEMKDLFKTLFEKYMVPFELATVLLLGAIVAVICMLKKSFQKDTEDKVV